jgi:hypothetical protein
MCREILCTLPLALANVNTLNNYSTKELTLLQSCYSDFMSYTCSHFSVCVCVCVAVYSFIMCSFASPP